MASTSKPAIVSRSASWRGANRTSTQSCNQARLMRMTAASRELLQEAQVVLEIQADVVDVVTQHRKPIDAHTERVSRIALRVDAHIAQDRRMHDAGTRDLEPTGLLADATAAPVAEHALDVHFRRGLGEREVRRTQPHLQGPLEEALDELV